MLTLTLDLGMTFYLLTNLPYSGCRVFYIIFDATLYAFLRIKSTPRMLMCAGGGFMLLNRPVYLRVRCLRAFPSSLGMCSKSFAICKGAEVQDY